MPEIDSENFSAIVRSFQNSSLTDQQLFRLWSAAIKDDETLVDEIIRRVYEDMMAFDRDRSTGVMAMIVRRATAARCAFGSLLKDIGGFRVFARPLGELQSIEAAQSGSHLPVGTQRLTTTACSIH